MLRRLLTLSLTLSLGLVLSGQAQSSMICGKTTVPDNDCDSNATQYSESCCPPGYRVQGVIYNDLKGQDNADAVGAVCRHVQNGNIKIASDFDNRGNNGRKGPVQFVCDHTEVMIGLACKDLVKKDALDGCTAVCYNPKRHTTRIMDNYDITSNPRSYVMHTIELPYRVAGIGYKEERKGSHGSTDRADCANVSYHYEPIVKP